MESERLLFREIELSDTQFIVDIRSAPEVYRYFISPHKITIEEHIDWFQNNYCLSKDRIDYIAVEKTSNSSVGVFGIIITGDRVEINYIVQKEFQNRGFGREGVICLLNYARNELHCVTAVAEIHQDNTPSLALAKGLGFTKVSGNGKILRFEKRL